MEAAVGQVPAELTVGDAVQVGWSLSDQRVIEEP